MGFIVLDTVDFSFRPAISNTYIAFGTTNALITASFDENDQRVYTCDISYGIWESQMTFMYGLEPMVRIPIHVIGNSTTVSNIHTFLYNDLFDDFSDNIIDDGLDN